MKNIIDHTNLDRAESNLIKRGYEILGYISGNDYIKIVAGRNSKDGKKFTAYEFSTIEQTKTK